VHRRRAFDEPALVGGGDPRPRPHAGARGPRRASARGQWLAATTWRRTPDG
jgi:hypothetical protein